MISLQFPPNSVLDFLQYTVPIVFTACFQNLRYGTSSFVATLLFAKLIMYFLLQNSLFSQILFIRNIISPEAASGGAIGLVRDGDIIEINIPERSINVRLSDEELAERRKAEEARGKKAFTPPTRQREVSKALIAYGKMVSSADKGGVRIVED